MKLTKASIFYCGHDIVYWRSMPWRLKDHADILPIMRPFPLIRGAIERKIV